jgi:hypothetical protein
MSEGTGQSQSEVVKIINNVTAKAQADPNYRREYVSDPNATLSSAGLKIPPGLKFKVIEGLPRPDQIPDNTKNLVHLVLPIVDERIADDSSSMKAAASGSCTGTASTFFTIPSCVSCASTASTNSC